MPKFQAALNRTELNFDGVKYLEAQEQPITLQNTGTDLFEFESVSNSLTFLTTPWSSLS